MALRIVVVPPRGLNKLKETTVNHRVARIVAEEVNIHERMFGRFTRTWKAGHKPKWKKEFIVSRNTIIAKMSTGSKPFVYVEGGTPLRYVKMSHNFKAKTKPGVIGSGAGAGHVMGWANRPLPGVTARDIRHAIADRRSPLFTRKVAAAIRGVLS